MGEYIMAAALFVAAVEFGYYVRRLSQSKVAIHEQGFVVHRGSNRPTFAWDEIECLTERVVHEGLPLKGVTGKLSARIMGKKAYRYTVARNDGEAFLFDNNVVPRGALLAGPLRTAQRSHDFRWSTETD